MGEKRYMAMVTAVDMARSGLFNNWWTIAARLRLRCFEQDALNWSNTQRQWLDSLCAEARSSAAHIKAV